MLLASELSVVNPKASVSKKLSDCQRKQRIARSTDESRIVRTWSRGQADRTEHFFLWKMKNHLRDCQVPPPNCLIGTGFLFSQRCPPVPLLCPHFLSVCKQVIVVKVSPGGALGEISGNIRGFSQFTSTSTTTVFLSTS